MKKLSVLLVLLMCITDLAFAQMGALMDGFSKGYERAGNMQMQDEQLRILRMQRQEMEEMRRYREAERQQQEQREYEQRIAEQKRLDAEYARKLFAEEEAEQQKQIALKKQASEYEEARRDWFRQIASFKKITQANEGINYDDPRLGALWDKEIRRLGGETQNSEKDAIWFLSEAHKNVKKMLAQNKKTK